jgi:hypothetical protein
MNLLRIVSCYATNSESVDIAWILLAGVPLFFYGIISFVDHGPSGLAVPVTVAVVVILVYFTIRRACSRYFINNIKDHVSRVGELLPSSRTSDQGTDAIDLEVLKEIRDVGGDALQVMAAYSNSPFKQTELIPRVVRLYALHYVTVDRSKLTLTPEGQEILNTPSYLLRAYISPEIAGRLVEIRSELNLGNFDGVMNKTNKLFEYMLRQRLRSVQDIATKWSELRKEGRVNHDFEVCGLGELRGACDELQIFKKGDIYEELLGAFSKLNNPQKHETRTSVDPSKAAQSSVELATAFIRNWFP